MVSLCWECPVSDDMMVVYRLGHDDVLVMVLVLYELKLIKLFKFTMIAIKYRLMVSLCHNNRKS